MFENEEIRRMHIQKTAKIRDDLCFSIHKEEFSQTAVNSVWELTETETNMNDALDIKKKIRNIDFTRMCADLFYSKQLFVLNQKTETIISVCKCSADFKAFLEEVTAPCYNDFTCYKEIVVLTNFWCNKTFDKYKRDLLDLSVTDDIKIGFFLVTDYGTSKILRIS